MRKKDEHSYRHLDNLDGNILDELACTTLHQQWSSKVASTFGIF